MELLFLFPSHSLLICYFLSSIDLLSHLLFHFICLLLFISTPKSPSDRSVTIPILKSTRTALSSAKRAIKDIPNLINRASLHLFEMASGPRSVVIDAKDGKHTATIIFLHGLGDSGHGWADTFATIKPSYCKIICPNAPAQPVTLNAGMIMPSWFDLMTLTHDGPEDSEGIANASANIMKIIEEEQSKYNIPSNRIILGGFSQGGALSLHTGLRYFQPLAGIMAFSCWLPLHKEYPGAFVQTNKEVPVLQCHGDADPLVPKMWGNLTADILKEILSSSEFKVYPNMGHSSCNAELQDAAQFIKKCLPPL